MLLPYIPADYNLDGLLDVADVDEQSQLMFQANPDLDTYDENADGVVDKVDRAIWVHDHAGTWLGDANINGEFNSNDMVRVFVAGKYEPEEAAGWAEGDWDGNGIFDSSDMVTALADGGYEKGPRTDEVAVPEPGAWLLLVMGAVTIFRTRRWGT